MKNIVRTLLIIPILVIGIGCESIPKKAEPVSLGGVAGGVLQAVDTTADIQERVDKAYDEGLQAKSAEARALQQQVRALTLNLQFTQEELAKAEISAQKKSDEANRAIAKADRLEASAEARNNWIVLAWYGSLIAFGVGYLISTLFFTTVSFSGPWGMALNFLTRFLPLQVVVGLLCVLAGGVILKTILSIWSGVGWIARLFGFG